MSFIWPVTKVTASKCIPGAVGRGRERDVCGERDKKRQGRERGRERERDVGGNETRRGRVERDKKR